MDQGFVKRLFAINPKSLHTPGGNVVGAGKDGKVGVVNDGVGGGAQDDRGGDVSRRRLAENPVGGQLVRRRQRAAGRGQADVDKPVARVRSAKGRPVE